MKWIDLVERDRVFRVTAWCLDHVPMPDRCWNSICHLQGWRVRVAMRRWQLQVGQ